MKNNNLKKNMLWNAAGNLIYLVCQWLITIFVANIGSFADAGLLSIAMSISATFQTIAMFGIRNFQVSDIENKYSNTCYVTLRIFTCGAAMLLCMAFSLVTGYRSEELLCVFLFMLFRLSENFSDVLHGIAQKNDRLDIAGKSYTIKGIGSLAAFLITFKLSSSLSLSLLFMALISWLFTIVYDITIVKRLDDFKLLSASEKWFSLAQNTLPLCIYLFLNIAISTIPKLILEQHSGNEILGIYSSIFAPALLIASAASYLYTPFVPYFAEAYAKKDAASFTKMFLKITAAIAAVAAVMLVAAAFLGDFALKILFGEKILAYSYLLIPILIAIFANAIFTFLCTVCVVLRDFVGLLVACSAGILSEILITKNWIEQSGVNATNYGYIVASCIGAAILLFRMLWILYGKRKKGV